MKPALRWAAAAVAALVLAGTASAQLPPTSACTYQGYLEYGVPPAPLTGACDLRFNLYDAAVAGNRLSQVTRAAHAVTRGLFTADLDFGAQHFKGEARWLEIEVRYPAGAGAYTPLAPRQEMMPGAYAMLALDLKLPYSGNVASNVAAFQVTQTGIREAGVFDINNPGSAWTALYSSTDGTGLALQASNVGNGPTAFFDIAAPNNPSDVMHAAQFGLGQAGFFEITNPQNVSMALGVRTDGLGPAARIWINNVNNNGQALWVSTNGGGPAAQFDGNVLVNGRLGVGTLNPQQPLDIAGVARMTGFMMPTAAAAGRVLTSDAAGVGTWQPAPIGIGGGGTAGYVPRFATGSTLADSSMRMVGSEVRVAGHVQAATMESTVAAPTPPLTVASDARVANLNADMVDGMHAGQLGQRTHFLIPGGGGSVRFAIPHYNACQITIGEASGTPNEVAFVHVIENDRRIAYIGYDGGGNLVRGAANLWNVTTILTLRGGNITLSTPGDGTYNLDLSSLSEDVRGVLIW